MVQPSETLGDEEDSERRLLLREEESATRRSGAGDADAEAGGPPVIAAAQPQRPDTAAGLPTASTEVEALRDVDDTGDTRAASVSPGAPEVSPGDAAAGPPTPTSVSSSSSSSSSDSSASTLINIAPEAAPATAQPRRRPPLWTLPFCSPRLSWLHVTNALVYFVLFCLNVVMYSEAVWPSLRAVDKRFGPIVTPAGWVYYLRDFILFLWALAVGCQSLAEHKGWKEGLLEAIGHSWQVLWYSDAIWMVLYVSASPAGLAMAPFFSFAALLAALAAHSRLFWALPDLHAELQGAGHAGVPALGYLLYVYPTSMAAGWLLVLHCHAATVAIGVLTGSDQAATTAGCVSLVMATALALLLLIRLRDIVFGLAFTWSMAAIWVAGFATNDDYRPDQLVAFFCALVLGLLTYCVAAGPQAAPHAATGGGALYT